MNSPLVTVITPTTGSAFLSQACRSVESQTYKNIQHLIVIDGLHHKQKTENQIASNADVIVLPYATGVDNYLGHRIYGASTYLAKGEYLVFLDEDNWLDANHIESLVKALGENKWSFSLRKIVDSKGNFICRDNCESLGNWLSVLNDYFVDVNCYLLHKSIALQFSPGWYRRARNTIEQPEVDRLLRGHLKKTNLTANCTGKYTLNYRAGNRNDSVQAKFFLNGNEAMGKKYNGKFPWEKEF